MIAKERTVFTDTLQYRCMVSEKGRDMALLISAAAIGNFLIAFDMNMLNIALPTITSEFDLDIATSTWLVIVHGIILCSLLLPFGRAGDVIGHRRLFLTGISLFGLANLAAGLSIVFEDFIILVFLRSLSAIGAAMMLSVNFAIISSNLPMGMRGRGLGYSAVFGSLGFMTGPIVSGLLLTFFQWNSLFILLAVIASIGLLLGLKVIPESGGSGVSADTIQTVAFFLTVLFLVLAINRYLIDGPSMLVSISATFAIVSAVVVIWREKVSKHPLLDPDLIFEPRVILPLISMSLLFMCFSGMMVLLPFYLEYVRQMETAAIGMMFIIPAIIITFLGPASGKASDVHGSYRLTLMAAGVMVVSMLFFLSIERIDLTAVALVGLVFMGISYGGFNAPNNRRVFCSVSLDRMGAASGMHQTMRHIGNVLGAATMPAVYQVVAGPTPSVGMMVNGFQASFLVGLFFALMALIVSASIRKDCRV